MQCHCVSPSVTHFISTVGHRLLSARHVIYPNCSIHIHSYPFQHGILRVRSLGPTGSPNTGQVTLNRWSNGHLRVYRAQAQFFQELGMDLPFPEGKSQSPYNDPPKAVHDLHPLTSLTSMLCTSLNPLWPPQIPVVAISRTLQALSGRRALVQTVPSAWKCFPKVSAWLSLLPSPSLRSNTPHLRDYHEPLKKCRIRTPPPPANSVPFCVFFQSTCRP